MGPVNAAGTASCTSSWFVAAAVTSSPAISRNTATPTTDATGVGSLHYRCHRCRVGIREKVLEAKILERLPPIDVDPQIPTAARIHAAAAEYTLRDGEIGF